VFSGYQTILFEYLNPDHVEICTDEDYLNTIIRNLTSNAINVFTTTENPHIIWKAHQEHLPDGKAIKTVLSITDNGPGADNENFARYTMTRKLSV